MFKEGTYLPYLLKTRSRSRERVSTDKRPTYRRVFPYLSS